MIIKNSGYLFDDEDIEEIASDVFLVIWKNKEKLDINKEIAPYIAGITKNLILKSKNNIKNSNENIDEFENYQKQYSDYEIVGDTHLVGIPEKEVDLANHIYTLSTLEKEIENVDGLVPRYIKEVEAKKICQ